jgi:hypothetical protein
MTAVTSVASMRASLATRSYRPIMRVLARSSWAAAPGRALADASVVPGLWPRPGLGCIAVRCSTRSPRRVVVCRVLLPVRPTGTCALYLIPGGSSYAVYCCRCVLWRRRVGDGRRSRSRSTTRAMPAVLEHSRERCGAARGTIVHGSPAAGRREGIRSSTPHTPRFGPSATDGAAPSAATRPSGSAADGARAPTYAPSNLDRLGAPAPTYAASNRAGAARRDGSPAPLRARPSPSWPATAAGRSPRGAPWGRRRWP